jgi:hypothetical protein
MHHNQSKKEKQSKKKKMQMQMQMQIRNASVPVDLGGLVGEELGLAHELRKGQMPRLIRLGETGNSDRS